MKGMDLAWMLRGMDAAESCRELDLILDLTGMPEVQGQDKAFTPELAAILYTRESHGMDQPETFGCRIQVMEVGTPGTTDYQTATWMSASTTQPEPELAPEWVTALVALHAPNWYPRHEAHLPRTAPPERRLRSV